MSADTPRPVRSGPKPTSVLCCPACRFEKEEVMPTGACQFFYECAACGALLRPEPGDCCVFCSYGSQKCPPVQERERLA